MKRVVVLGPGGSGKSTFAKALSEKTGLPRTELDAVFWLADLQPTPAIAWARRQRDLSTADAWILDGDLGPYDVVHVRLQRADAVVLFDVATWRCVWRALRRSRERLDFWRWLLTWRRRYRPQLLQAIAQNAPPAKLFVVRRPKEAAVIVANWADPPDR